MDPVEREDVLHIGFNQDATCMSVGTTMGLRVYNCDPFRKYYDSHTTLGVQAAAILGSTSLLAFVGSGDSLGSSLRTLKLFNLQTSQEICSLNFASTVITVHISENRLISVTESKIFVFDLKTMEKLAVLETFKNREGVCSVYWSHDECIIAFPSASSIGDVAIYDAISLQSVRTLSCHSTQVGALAFSQDGVYIASTSCKGTLVRVTSISQGEPKFVFRRGLKRATIRSLSFSSDNKYLAVASNHSTVHIFSLRTSSAMMKDVSKAILPVSLHNALDPQVSVTKIKIRENNGRIYAQFHGTNSLHIASTSGYLYRYSIDSRNVAQLNSEDALFDVEDVLGVQLYEHDEEYESESVSGESY